MFYGVLGLIVSMIISGIVSLAYTLWVVVYKFGMVFDVRSVVRIYLAAFYRRFLFLWWFLIFLCLVVWLICF